jgi:hypothetical protein
VRAKTSAMPAPIVPSPTTPMDENSRLPVMGPMMARLGPGRADR